MRNPFSKNRSKSINYLIWPGEILATILLTMSTQKEKNKQLVQQAIDAAKAGIVEDKTNAKGEGVVIIYGEEVEDGVVSELFLKGSHNTIAHSLAGFAEKSDGFFEILAAAYKIAAIKRDPMMAAISSALNKSRTKGECPCEDCVADRAKSSPDVN